MTSHDDHAPLDVLAHDAFIQSVRKRPGMYFGDVSSSRAAEHVVNELSSNVIDLFLQGRASRLHVLLGPSSIHVHDDGPGFPFFTRHEGMSLATYLFLYPHATPSAFAHAPHIHIHRMGGIGLAPINAISHTLRCTSWIDGMLWSQSFRDGVLVDGPRAIERGDGVGSSIQIELSSDVLEVVTPDHHVVRRRLFDAVHLFAGLRASLGEETFHAPDGLAALARFYEARALHGEPLFHVRHRDEAILLEAVALGRLEGEDEVETRWKTWVNGRATPLHGMHRHLFSRVLDAHGWRPRVALIHLVTSTPQYASPTTDELQDARADGIDAILDAALEQFLRG